MDLYIHLIKEDSYLRVQYQTGQTYGFCAKAHVGGFSLNSTTAGEFKRVYSEHKKQCDTRKDMALFIAGYMVDASGYTKLVLSDVEDYGMHAHISKYLPLDFVTDGGEHVTVTKEDPYINHNSGNTVQEVVLHKEYR